MNCSELQKVLDVVGVNIYSSLLPSELHALTLSSRHLSEEVPKHLVRTCIEVFSKSVGYYVEDKNGNHFTVGFTKGDAIPSKGEVVYNHLQHVHRDGLRIQNTKTEEDSMKQATSLIENGDKLCFLPFVYCESEHNVLVSPQYTFEEERHELTPSEHVLSSMWICNCKVKKSRDFVRRAWVYRHLGIKKNQVNTFSRLDLIRAWVYCLLHQKQNRVVSRSCFDVSWQVLNLNISEHTITLYKERTDSYLVCSELGDTITLEQYQLRV